MDRKYLGDSFDIVKRFWQEVIYHWAPLYANPRFIPKELRKEFTQLTRIKIWEKGKKYKRYAILNDPDTGIRSPNGKNQSEGVHHIRLATIIDQLSSGGPRCVVTFDQAFRRHRIDAKQQRHSKLRHLHNKGISAFYYVSHAPFLFAFPNKSSLEELKRILIEAGIPSDRIEDNL
jgi:hypothetical protein